MRIAQHLELNVPRPLDKLFHVEIAVAKSRCGLRLRGVKRALKLGFIADHAHAASASTGGSLYNHGIADLRRPFARFFCRGNHAVRSRQDRDLGFLHRLPRFFFLTHQPDNFRRRPNKFNMRAFADFGEVGVFAQQPVARMNSVNVGNFSRADHCRNVEIAFRRARRPNANGFVGKSYVQRIAVSVTVNGNSLHAQFFTGADHAQGNFSTICNQYLLKHYFLGRIANSGCPYSTGCPLLTSTFTTSPEASASISFMSFMASIMQSTWPAAT